MTTPNPNTQITPSEYMRRPENFKSFEDLLGKGAMPYVQSVLIAVSASDDLMACTPNSIQRAALRAASLGLSCDPALKQAWLVPFPRKIKATTKVPEHYITEAVFIPHYRGLHTLGMRTGKYYIINVGPIYDGQRVLENQVTGLHVVIQPDGLATVPEAYNRAYAIPHEFADWRDVTVRRNHDQQTIGWLAYFETRQGFKKSIYMSCVEIEEWACLNVKKYRNDKGQISNPNWRDPTKRPVMEMKTVFRQLMGWADLSGKENQHLAEALKISDAPDEDEPIEGETTTIETGDLTGAALAWKVACEKADQVGVPHDLKIEGLSDAELNEKVNELLAIVQDAEAQAKAGEEPQTPVTAPASLKAPIPAVAKEKTQTKEAEEQIDPLSDKAVEYAAKKWGLTSAKASKEINAHMLRLGPGSKFKNPMSKQDFKDAVNGWNKK